RICAGRRLSRRVGLASPPVADERRPTKFLTESAENRRTLNPTRGVLLLRPPIRHRPIFASRAQYATPTVRQSRSDADVGVFDWGGYARLGGGSCSSSAWAHARNAPGASLPSRHADRRGYVTGDARISGRFASAEPGAGQPLAWSCAGDRRLWRP